MCVKKLNRQKLKIFIWDFTERKPIKKEILNWNSLKEYYARLDLENKIFLKHKNFNKFYNTVHVLILSLINKKKFLIVLETMLQE